MQSLYTDSSPFQVLRHHWLVLGLVGTMATVQDTPGTIPVCEHDNLPIETFQVAFAKRIPQHIKLGPDAGASMRQECYDKYLAIASAMPRQVQRDWVKLFREGLWAVFDTARKEPRDWRHFKSITNTSILEAAVDEEKITVEVKGRVYTFMKSGLTAAHYVMAWMHWGRDRRLEGFRAAVYQLGNCPNFPCEPNDNFHTSVSTRRVEAREPIAPAQPPPAQPVDDTDIEVELDKLIRVYGQPDWTRAFKNFVNTVVASIESVSG